MAQLLRNASSNVAKLDIAGGEGFGVQRVGWGRTEASDNEIDKQNNVNVPAVDRGEAMSPRA